MMQRIEILVSRAFHGHSPPASLFHLCDHLNYTYGPGHPVLSAALSQFNIADLRFTAAYEFYIEAHVRACKAFNFSQSLGLEVCVDALSCYMDNRRDNQPLQKPLLRSFEFKRRDTEAILKRLEWVNEATPGHNEAYPDALQPWLSLLVARNGALVQANEGVARLIRAEVIRVMNELHY